MPPKRPLAAPAAPADPEPMKPKRHRGEVKAIVVVTKENRLAIMAPLDDVLGNIEKIVPGEPRHDGSLF